MESLSYRSIIVASQRISWFLSQLLRVRYWIRADRPAGVFDRASECCLILAPTHQAILDPALIMRALPYRCWRALIPLRVLATQTFGSALLQFFKPIIMVIYWLWGVIELPPMNNGDGTLPEKLEDLLERLRHGDVIMIFPEGEIGTPRDPPVDKFAPGVIYLHRNSGAPIVPIAVFLSDDWLPRRNCVIQIDQREQMPEHLSLEAGAEWLRERTLALYEQAKELSAG